MTTMQDAVNETKRLVYGSLNDQINLIGTDAAAGATTVVMDMDVSGITPGMVLSSGLNVWYVRSIDTAANSVQVIPGYEGSPAQAVTAGQFVYIKPRVTDWYLFNTVNNEIKSLSSTGKGLYKIGSWTAQVDPTYQTYEIPDAVFPIFTGLLRMRYRMPGTTDVWYDLPEKAYRVQINPTDGASHIRLLRNVPSGTQIEFVYRGAFSPATSLADDLVDVCGLTSTMTDIPALGAAVTLLRTTESRRNQITTQGDARQATDVRSGANSNAAVLLQRQYDDRVGEEYMRLAVRNPIVRSL